MSPGTESISMSSLSMTMSWKASAPGAKAVVDGEDRRWSVRRSGSSTCDFILFFLNFFRIHTSDVVSKGRAYDHPHEHDETNISFDPVL